MVCGEHGRYIRFTLSYLGEVLGKSKVPVEYEAKVSRLIRKYSSSVVDINVASPMWSGS